MEVRATTQRGEEVSHRAHNPETDGANPSAVTIVTLLKRYLSAKSLSILGEWMEAATAKVAFRQFVTNRSAGHIELSFNGKTQDFDSCYGSSTLSSSTST